MNQTAGAGVRRWGATVRGGVALTLAAAGCAAKDRDVAPALEAVVRVERAVLVPGAGLAPAVLYADLVNRTDTPDTLTRIDADGAQSAMLHGTVADSAGRVTMHMVSFVEIPARGTARLVPGALHGMIQGLSPAPTRGDSISVTFTFVRTGAVTVAAAIIDYADVERVVRPAGGGAP
jgi:copper(I)-binding protein